MKVRADVVAMLREGRHSQAHIMRTLHVSHGVVKAARQYLGLPAPAVGRTRSRESLEEAFAARTEPADGGHLRWTGAKTAAGTPQLGYRGTYLPGYVVAFRLRYGRDPVGRALPGCDMPGCVALDHIEDQPMRERNRRAFAAIFGSALAEEASSDA
ncbi:hypothetical protein E3E14_25170 [Streptomyces sp. ICN441]|uniref:hypothetical protein n=1 Tax=Streptomyces sp. ICN441 TaxID=2558286 RepID=UPI001068F2B9|nr:hypothetical protein [Streptomyces sp. ICN441]TFE42478.1 hypothetical protein E3E14_25170 [Streptomyces sp. ICN441]